MLKIIWRCIWIVPLYFLILMITFVYLIFSLSLSDTIEYYNTIR
jgi:hypothetical protein